MMQKILESGAIIFEENCIESRYDDIELRATGVRRDAGEVKEGMKREATDK